MKFFRELDVRMALSIAIGVYMLGGMACTNGGMSSDTRYLSSSISCETDERCFSLIDSLVIDEQGKITLENIHLEELSRADTIINFFDYNGEIDHATTLVVDNYMASETGKYILRLGSDDGYRIFVNGEEIASRIIGRSLQLDSDWIPIELNQGSNQLIIQINQGLGNWKLHYRIDKEVNLVALIEDQLIELYRDLPDLNIIPDSSEVLVLNRDPRQNLDVYHKLEYNWVNVQTGEEVLIGRYLANEAPVRIELPEERTLPMLFRYKVLDITEGQVYAETIPVFTQQAVDELVPKTFKKLSADSGNNQWIKGLEFCFPERLGVEKIHNYSTRTKSEFLFDALKQSGDDFINIGGPRYTNINGLISRVYYPDIHTKNTLKVFGLFPQPIDSVSHFMKVYYGRDHNALAVRSSYARYFNAELTFPFIKEYTNSNNLSMVLGAYIDQLEDTTSFDIIAWSNSVPLLMDELAVKSIPVKHVAILGSLLGDDPTDRFILIQKIRQHNPDIEWYIWHGEEDRRVPVTIMEHWVEALQEQGFQVTFTRLPLTNHEVYFTDPRKEFYHILSEARD